MTFTKSDGTERIMLCTLLEEYIQPYEKKTSRQRQDNEDTISVWDLEKNAWRSFRIDSIKNIHFTIG